MDKNGNSKTVILVGNGSSVLLRDGAEIDAYDTVVRFSGFRVQGYEKHVGTRTDVWFGYNAPHPQLSTFKQVIFPSIGNLNMAALRQAIKSACQRHRVPFEQLSHEVVKKAYQLLRLIPTQQLKPTTGFAALVWAMEHYSTVAITGFDYYSNGLHYYQPNGIPQGFSKTHVPQKERTIIGDWILNETIKNL